MSDTDTRNENPDREELVHRIIEALDDAPYKTLFLIWMTLKK